MYVHDIHGTNVNTGFARELPLLRVILLWPDPWAFIGWRRIVAHRTRRDFLINIAYFDYFLGLIIARHDGRTEPLGS